MVLGQAVAQEFKGFFRIIYDLDQVEILGRHCAGVHEGLEVDDLVPVLAAVDDDQDFLRELFGLREREDLEKFVHGTEAAGKDDESFGEIRKPELTHEEVMKLEIERGRDELVGVLLERKLDVQTDTLASGFEGAQIGGLHNARAAAGGNDESMAASGDG